MYNSLIEHIHRNEPPKSEFAGSGLLQGMRRFELRSFVSANNHHYHHTLAFAQIPCECTPSAHGDNTVLLFTQKTEVHEPERREYL